MKQFLTEFYAETDEGKVFTYAEQLTDIAHREQVELVIDLDDVAEVSIKQQYSLPVNLKVVCV